MWPFASFSVGNTTSRSQHLCTEHHREEGSWPQRTTANSKWLQEIQSRAVAGFHIYEEMRKYFPIYVQYEEVVSHIWLCNCSILNSLNMRKFFIFQYRHPRGVPPEIVTPLLVLFKNMIVTNEYGMVIIEILCPPIINWLLPSGGVCTFPSRFLGGWSSLQPGPVFLNVWSPGIDSKEWIPPAYVSWRAGTITLFLLGS